jgi:hypothetical protein
LPVLMLAAFVALHARRLGGVLLFHVFWDLESCDYVNFGFARQATISGVRLASSVDCERTLTNRSRPATHHNWRRRTRNPGGTFGWGRA